MSESRDSLKKKRIRSFFLSFETSAFEEIETENIHEEIENIGLTYIQMRLPVAQITPEFEAKLKEKVEHNVLHAKIREASAEDLPGVTVIHNRAWMTSNTPFAHLNLETLKDIHDYPETVILVANVYGTEGGFIILDYEGPNNEFGVIAGLGILPRFQRKGLGTVLGLAGWKYLKEKGVEELHCEVYIDNEASYNFITSLGFEEYETVTYQSDGFLSQ